jgi:DNA-binding response OmpR family regulator
MTLEKILLVEQNARIIEMLVESFVRRFNAHITCVASAADALDVEMFEPHSIAVIDTRIEDMDAITLAMRLRELGDRPVILMGSDPTTADVIEAMRCGVTDFFTKPFEIEALLDCMAAPSQPIANVAPVFNGTIEHAACCGESFANGGP